MFMVAMRLFEEGRQGHKETRNTQGSCELCKILWKILSITAKWNQYKVEDFSIGKSVRGKKTNVNVTLDNQRVNPLTRHSSNEYCKNRYDNFSDWFHRILNGFEREGRLSWKTFLRYQLIRFWSNATLLKTCSYGRWMEWNWDKEYDLNLNLGSDLVLILIQNVSTVIYLASLSGWSEIFFRFSSLVFKNHSCCCKCHLRALYFSENYLIKIRFSCFSRFVSYKIISLLFLSWLLAFTLRLLANTSCLFGSTRVVNFFDIYFSLLAIKTSFVQQLFSFFARFFTF